MVNIGGVREDAVAFLHWIFAGLRPRGLSVFALLVVDPQEGSLQLANALVRDDRLVGCNLFA